MFTVQGIKKKENISFTEKTKTVGIISGKRGEGSTTMAIALCSYLSGVKRIPVAIAEIGQKQALYDIEDVYFGKNHEDSFELFDVQYYRIKDLAGLPWLYEKKYKCVVVDFGTEYEKYMGEFMRCSIKLVMGSVNLWRYGDYIKLCHYIKAVPGSDGWFHIVSGDSKDVRAHLKKESLAGTERVMIANPYVIENQQLEFFQRIL